MSCGSRTSSYFRRRTRSSGRRRRIGRTSTRATSARRWPISRHASAATGPREPLGLAGIFVAQHLLEVDAANDAVRVIGEAPRVDGRQVGEDASLEGLVDRILVIPAAAGPARAAELVGTTEQRAVARRGIPLARPGRRRDDVCERGQRRFLRIKRAQQNVDPRAVLLAGVLAKALLAGEKEQLRSVASVTGRRTSTSPFVCLQYAAEAESEGLFRPAAQVVRVRPTAMPAAAPGCGAPPMLPHPEKNTELMATVPRTKLHHHLL